jgi:putative acetyltransferase
MCSGGRSGSRRRAHSPEQVEAWATVADADPANWASRRARVETVVAVEGDRVVGFSDTDEAGYIDMLFVDPDFGRRGIATALLSRVTQRAQELGAPEQTTHASLIARPFFEARGFAFVSELCPARQGVSMPSFLLRRALPGPAAR